MKAIDVHVHDPAPAEHASSKETEDMAAYFGSADIQNTPEAMYQH